MKNTFPEIWACVIFYNDGPEMLKTCFDACRAAGLQGIVAVDGAFAEYPHKDFRSTDGCLELARNGGADIVIEAPGRPWRDECEKRSQYFKKIKSGNFALWIDADEFLSGGRVDRRFLCHDYYMVQLKNAASNETSIRGFRVYSDLVHKNRHPVVCRSWETRFEPYRADHFIITDQGYLTIVHKPELRSEARLADDAVFLRGRAENGVPLVAPVDIIQGKPPEIKPEVKIIVPPENATGINRWVKVRFNGDFFYSGHLVHKPQKGTVYPFPYWRYQELIQQHGKGAWELCEQL